MGENPHHVFGAHVERVGIEGGLEQASGLGLAADLHVEHAQAESGRRHGRGRRQQLSRNARSAEWYFPAVRQPLAQCSVENGRTGVILQRGQLGGGRPRGIDQKSAGGCQPGQCLFVARVFGDGVERRGPGI